MNDNYAKFQKQFDSRTILWELPWTSHSNSQVFSSLFVSVNYIVLPILTTITIVVVNSKFFNESNKLIVIIINIIIIYSHSEGDNSDHDNK